MSLWLYWLLFLVCAVELVKRWLSTVVCISVLSLGDGMPTWQLLPHSSHHSGFTYTSISTPQEFPSSLTFICQIDNFPLTSSLLSALAATLSSSSVYPLPPSLSSPYSFKSNSHSPSTKKAQTPLPPLAPPLPSQFTRRARGDQLCGEWVYLAFSDLQRQGRGWQ